MKYLVAFCLLAFLSCKSEKEDKPVLVSEEKKETIHTIENPSSQGSQLPRLFSNGEDLYFSWVHRTDSVDVLNYSVFEKNAWQASQEVVRGTDWFTNWADFPSIAESGGNILTSFLQKSASGTYTYDVKLNLYNAKTKTWKKNFILHKDGTESEHGFVSIRPYVGNSFLVAWLDGRDTAGKGHGEGQMTLRAAIVFEDGTIDYDTLIDNRVCDCCQTGATIVGDDQILVTYRDRSDTEIRDISLVRWTQGLGWLPPQTIGNDNWKIPGCPVNGPSIDDKGKTVAISWFTAASGEGEVNIAFSKDEGASFGNSIRIDAGNATGRVDVAMLSETEAAVLWMEPKGENELIRLVKVATTGEISQPITVAVTSPERASGFPQLELVGTILYMAWTMTDDNGSHIEMANVDMKLL